MTRESTDLREDKDQLIREMVIITMGDDPLWYTSKGSSDHPISMR